MEQKVRCPRCGRERHQHRHGTNKSGTGRSCYVCKFTYTPAPAKYVYSEEERNTAIKLYYESNSSRAVGRVLGMSKANAVRWVKKNENYSN